MKKKYIYAFPKIAISSLFNKKFVQCNFFPKDKNAVLLSSGRAAIYNAVKILNLKGRDSILVPAYHCGVEIESLIRAGVKIRYYRIKKNMAVDKEDLEKKKDGDIKALFIIHYWGFPQDISWIQEYCKKRNIILIEDCAHALYSKSQGRLLGTLGEVGIYSLSKTLAVPNGGILFINRNSKNININSSQSNWQAFKVATRSALESATNIDFTLFSWGVTAILSLKVNNKKKSNIEHRRFWEDPLYRFTEKISLPSRYLLSHYNPEKIIDRRRNNYLTLLKYLLFLGGIEVPFKNLDEYVCPLFFPIIIEDREALQRYLLQNRIETFVFGRNLHSSLEIKSYPESQFLSEHILGLPIHQDLSKNDIENIAEKIDTWGSAEGRI